MPRKEIGGAHNAYEADARRKGGADNMKAHVSIAEKNKQLRELKEKEKEDCRIRRILDLEEQRRKEEEAEENARLYASSFGGGHGVSKDTPWYKGGGKKDQKGVPDEEKPPENNWLNMLAGVVAVGENGEGATPKRARDRMKERARKNQLLQSLQSAVEDLKEEDMWGNAFGGVQVERESTVRTQNVSQLEDEEKEEAEEAATWQSMMAGVVAKDGGPKSERERRKAQLLLSLQQAVLSDEDMWGAAFGGTQVDRSKESDLCMGPESGSNLGLEGGEINGWQAALAGKRVTDADIQERKESLANLVNTLMSDGNAWTAAMGGNQVTAKVRRKSSTKAENMGEFEYMLDGKVLEHSVLKVKPFPNNPNTSPFNLESLQS